MIINIQYVEMTFSETMTEVVIGKLNKLGEKYEWILKAKVFFKGENNPVGSGKICEIGLSMPGTRVFAFSREINFDLAIRETIIKLEKQLRRKKDFLNYSSWI